LVGVSPPSPDRASPPTPKSGEIPAKSGGNGDVPPETDNPLEALNELLRHCDRNEANKILEGAMTRRWHQTTEWQRQCLRSRGVRVPDESYIAAMAAEVPKP
jgi:hypothetical protein